MEHPRQTSSNHFNTNFCLVMANHVLLTELEKGSNFVFSPLSFHLMLGWVAMGSSGRTLEQLLSCLGLKSGEDLRMVSSKIVAIALPVNGSENFEGGPILSFINGAWVEQSFRLKPSFERIVKGVYNAIAKEVDFATKADQVKDEINLWAENATKGLIKNLLPSLDTDTTLVLANALYFKGAWNQKFDPSKTEYRDFHLLNGQTVRAPFMTANKYESPGHLYGSFDDHKVLKIPYQNGQDPRQFSMYFFLPNARDGLRNLIQKFKSNPEFLNKKFVLKIEQLSNFWIPKFKFSYEFEASKTVTELGLDLPFKDLGEFTEIVDSPLSLRLSNIFHKAFIEVNEEGTEAAACTAAVFQQQCARYPTSFVADHPFMFMVKEETSGIAFFIGAVVNPSVS